MDDASRSRVSRFWHGLVACATAMGRMALPARTPALVWSDDLKVGAIPAKREPRSAQNSRLQWRSYSNLQRLREKRTPMPAARHLLPCPVRVSRGTEPCDGVEQKTGLSGASLFCVRHRASTGVCPRSGPNGVGARGSPEGCRVTPLWARPARTRTCHDGMTYQQTQWHPDAGHQHASFAPAPPNQRCRSKRDQLAAPAALPFTASPSLLHRLARRKVWKSLNRTPASRITSWARFMVICLTQKGSRTTK